MAVGSTEVGLYMEKVDYKVLPASKHDPPYYEIQEAARAGLESAQRLLELASQQVQHDGQTQQVVCNSVADEALTNLRKMMNLLGRKGHARVRWGPRKARDKASASLQQVVPAVSEIMRASAPPTHNYSSSEPKYLVPSSAQQYHDQISSMCNKSNEYYQQQFLALQLQAQLRPQQPDLRSNHHMKLESSLGCAAAASCSLTTPSISVISSPSIEQSIGDNKQVPFRQPICTAQEGILQATSKKKCSGKGDDLGVKCGSGGKCVCSKRRKVRSKRTIEVPAISIKPADIPPDEFSWRKYGQKPIKGSPHPRGYYRCSNTRDCPARKHVERSPRDPTMLIVTYEGEHNHSSSLSTSGIVVVQS